ncbi:MAG: SDR family NAD(P)-dependent oxidoreductase [Acidobacteria bacterium]|nr:SDR family NAD(P)-dependent oxidoreductase [Acidobacteriota bacterium]
MTPGPVLITGCSSGIGRATALRLAASGRKVWATARRIESIAELAAAGCRTLALEVTDEESRRTAIQAVEAADGPLGALVNNAGYSQSGPLEEIPLDAVRRQFETNVFGLLRLCQLALPGMRQAGRGRIINVSSMGGKLTFPGGGAYHATKYAVEALSDALRFEVAGFGVDVVLIEPGIIRTDFSSAAIRQVPEPSSGPYAAFREAVIRNTRDVYTEGKLAKLGGEPDDVARVIERALDARRPKARYRVTASATVLMTLRAVLPDALWDKFLAGSFPRPR